MNKKGWKTAEKNVSNSFWVHAAPKSWSKYTTSVLGALEEGLVGRSITINILMFRIGIGVIVLQLLKNRQARSEPHLIMNVWRHKNPETIVLMAQQLFDVLNWLILKKDSGSNLQ